MLSNLLAYRFLLVNTVFVAGGVVLWTLGRVTPLFVQDTSYISYGIAALFAVSWCWAFREIVGLSMAINFSKRMGAEPATEPERDKDIGKVEWLNAVSGWLVALGLLGTIVGFQMALGAVDQSASGAKGAQNAVALLMKGMQVAINTTLIGAVLGLWNEVNYRLLRTGLNSYWSDRVTAGLR